MRSGGDAHGARSPASGDPGVPADERSREIDRLVFFSDAVFAFALTLLVQRILVPGGPDYTHQVLALWPKYLSYAISFFVVGRYWLGHHRMFRYIRRWDQRLILLDLALLFFIAFVPFPAAMIGERGAYRISLVFYAATVGCAGLASLLLWVYATQDHRLVAADLDETVIRRYRLSGMVAPAVFFLSIPLSFVSLNLGFFSWLLIPVALIALRRFGREREAAPPTSPPSADDS
jgi:TMEM175 potassium channel family protein